MTILTLNEKSKKLRTKSEIENDVAVPDGMESSVDWKIAENKSANKTECYDQNDVIVRRDGSITLSATFSRGVNELGDIVGFEFKTGAKPNLKAGTMARFDCAVDGKLAEDRWNGTISSDETTADISIHVPADACIGRYRVRIYLRTVTAEGKISTTYTTQPDIYVVANPYSNKDQCYFSKATFGLFNNFDEFVEEYCLNEGRLHDFNRTRSRILPYQYKCSN